MSRSQPESKPIKLWEITRKQVERNVNFPIYRKMTVSDSCVSYTCISEDLTAITITEETYVRGDYEYMLEHETKYDFDRSEIKYHLGLHEHSLTRVEFDNIFLLFLNRIETLKKKLMK